MNDKKRFGKFLEYLRTRKLVYDNKGYRHRTRDELGDAIGVSGDTIANIEQGKVSAKRHLDKLAQVLKLDEIQKRTFYAMAGHVYHVTPKIPDDWVMREVLQKIPYPASIRTALWDFLAFNEYHRVLWSYSLNGIDRMHEGDLGANMLRVLFDPFFQVAQGTLGNQNPEWRENAIFQFRRLSFPYVSTTRYNQIITLMNQNYLDFERAWLNADISSLNEMPSLLEIPKGTVLDHPDFGLLKFISLRVPDRDIGEGIKISVYVPSPVEQQGFAEFTSSIGENKVYLFKPQPVE